MVAVIVCIHSLICVSRIIFLIASPSLLECALCSIVCQIFVDIYWFLISLPSKTVHHNTMHQNNESVLHIFWRNSVQNHYATGHVEYSQLVMSRDVSRNDEICGVNPLTGTHSEGGFSKLTL